MLPIFIKLKIYPSQSCYISFLLHCLHSLCFNKYFLLSTGSQLKRDGLHGKHIGAFCYAFQYPLCKALYKSIFAFTALENVSSD